MKSADLIHMALLARKRCEWSDYTTNKAGQHVVRECSGSPTRTVRFLPDVDDDPGLRAIFARLHPGDVLRLGKSTFEKSIDISIVRIRSGTEHGVLKVLSRDEIDWARAPILGLEFIHMMRELDAAVPND